MKSNIRTIQQNKSLHLWAAHLAEELNDAGFTITKVLKHDVEIPWTKETVKELIIKPVVAALYKKDSTTKLTTKELSQVVVVIEKHLSEKTGVSIDFPSV